jgi:hypothetical protein
MSRAGILAIGFLVLFVGGGARFAIGLTLKSITEEFAIGRTVLGLTVAVYLGVSIGLHVPGGPRRRPAQRARRPGLGPHHQRGRHEPDVPDDGAVAAVCPLWRRLRGRQRRGLDHAGLADGESAPSRARPVSPTASRARA